MLINALVNKEDVALTSDAPGKSIFKALFSLLVIFQLLRMSHKFISKIVQIPCIDCRPSRVVSKLRCVTPRARGYSVSSGPEKKSRQNMMSMGNPKF